MQMFQLDSGLPVSIQRDKMIYQLRQVFNCPAFSIKIELENDPMMQESGVHYAFKKFLKNLSYGLPKHTRELSCAYSLKYTLGRVSNIEAVIECPSDLIIPDNILNVAIQESWRQVGGTAFVWGKLECNVYDPDSIASILEQEVVPSFGCLDDTNDLTEILYYRS